MIRSKRISSALLVALAVSGGCTLLLSRRMANAYAAEQRGTRRYVSPVRAIQPGEKIQSTDMHEIAWPANVPVEGALTKIEQVANRVALYPLAPGQPVLDRQMSALGSGPGLASKIPNGMRAIALKSDEVVGVAGFLNPGSHVDVLGTYRATMNTEPVSALVVQNAEVVAAGQQTEPDPSGKAVSATVVTLLLSPEQAERALLASSQGSVHFVLRNSADKGTSNDVPVTLSQLAKTSGTGTQSLGLMGTSQIPAGKLAGKRFAASHFTEGMAASETPIPGLGSPGTAAPRSFRTTGRKDGERHSATDDASAGVEVILGGQSGTSSAKQGGKL